ncbi:hypothetical protein NDU88_000648 [Pleurodeles waltl]|uniref:Uncharacterized protein n=1 Tax=Pleurodeles waltl TaxID=8319 RepID=A0AAV7TFF9_PLEWA|nr:hypothetical protein NDU88_000648 [Pleurodeles waltl]
MLGVPNETRATVSKICTCLRNPQEGNGTPRILAERGGDSIPVTALAHSKKKPKPPDFSRAWAKKGSVSFRAEERHQPAPHLRYRPAPEMGVAQRDVSTLTPSVYPHRNQLVGQLSEMKS